MVIDEKELKPIKASEIKIGGIFYLKIGEEYYTCCIHPEEVAHHPLHLKEWSKQFSKENRLFIRTQKPFQSFQS